MFTSKSNHAPVVLTGLLWDTFGMADAIAALMRGGFSEYEILRRTADGAQGGCSRNTVRRKQHSDK